jgi:hypothetical protein
MHDADLDAGETSVSAQVNGAPRLAALDPGRLVAYSWLMAAAAIGLLNLLHADLHEHHDPPPLVHWLRDAALAVPLAAIAVVCAALLVQARASGARTAGHRSIPSRLAWVVLTSFAFAVLSIPGIQLHGLLFGAEIESVGWLQDALTDGGITLAVSLVALVPAALITGPPWRTATYRQGPDYAPGATLSASAGSSAFLATAGSTHAGGDR